MQLERYWLSKFFIKNHVSLQITKQGILLDNVLITWSEFQTFPVIESHLFFYSINWQTHDENYHYNWLPRNIAHNALNLIIKHWVKLNRTHLIHLVNAIKTKMSGGYLGKNTLKNIQDKTATELNKWPSDISLTSFDDAVYKSLSFLL